MSRGVNGAQVTMLAPDDPGVARHRGELEVEHAVSGWVCEHLLDLRRHHAPLTSRDPGDGRVRLNWRVPLNHSPQSSPFGWL